MIKGLTFDGKHSYKDFGLYMETKSIQPPVKKKIKIDVPYMDSNYDFSTVGSNGEIIYSQRTITVILGLKTISKEKLYILYSKVLEWLQDISQSQLIFDDIKDYYFMAEVETVPTFDEMVRLGKLTVVFVCDPFKTSIDFATNNIWDTFNFEEDYLQDSDYDVVTTRTINIYNPGRLVMPIINCDSAMTIILNGKTYNLIIGNNKLYGFKFLNGPNNIVINGTGHIQIVFRKQVL